MELSEFKIGESFWCSGEQFRCTDVGTRTVVAIRIDQVETTQVTIKENSPTTANLPLDYIQAEKEGWFNGPPYAVAEIVFDEYDFPACHREKP